MWLLHAVRHLRLEQRAQPGGPPVALPRLAHRPHVGLIDLDDQLHKGAEAHRVRRLRLDGAKQEIHRQVSLLLHIGQQRLILARDRADQCTRSSRLNAAAANTMSPVGEQPLLLLCLINQ